MLGTRLQDDHRLQQRPRTKAFSLVELVLVVVIIGVIAAIAIPRISRAGTNAKRQAVQADLAVIRKAIELYYADHGAYPGYAPAAKTVSDAAFVKQLTQYTNKAGEAKPEPADGFVYGPYLRSPFPDNPINGLTTVKVFKETPSSMPSEEVGWIAVYATGDFWFFANGDALQELGLEKELSAVAKEVFNNSPSVGNLNLGGG